MKIKDIAFMDKDGNIFTLWEAIRGELTNGTTEVPLPPDYAEDDEVDLFLAEDGSRHVTKTGNSIQVSGMCMVNGRL